MQATLRQQLVIEKTARLLQAHPALRAPVTPVSSPTSPASPTSLPPITTNGKGTTWADLRAMPDAQLIARYQQLHTYLCRHNFTPRRLRATRDAATRKQDHIAKNEHSRIETVANERNLNLPLPAPTPDQPRNEYSTPQRGDTVETKYRNPNTGAIESGIGTVESVESARIGLIYHTRVNGAVFPLDRYGITKIILTEETANA